MTGGTSGIGRASAVALARLGSRVILLGRNERAARSIIREIESRDGSAEFEQVDLSNFQDVRAAATGILGRHPSIDTLINNAGARYSTYQRSASGIELTLAANHLGHFLLTLLLMRALRAPAAARVITVGSGAHAAADGRTWESDAATYDRRAAYAQSKLANIMFTYELARRLRHTAVTSNAVDPGGVATKLGLNNGVLAWLRHLVYFASRGELQRPARAAETVVHLATSADVAKTTGKYFRERREIRSSPQSYDAGAGERLWQYSVGVTGVDLDAGSE